jgi:hypothetical protein
MLSRQTGRTHGSRSRIRTLQMKVHLVLISVYPPGWAMQGQPAQAEVSELGRLSTIIGWWPCPFNRDELRDSCNL